MIIIAGADADILFWLLLVAAGALGVSAVLPIGGADMPGGARCEPQDFWPEWIVSTILHI